jgi:hypothetical protein
MEVYTQEYIGDAEGNILPWKEILNPEEVGYMEEHEAIVRDHLCYLQKLGNGYGDGCSMEKKISQTDAWRDDGALDDGQYVWELSAEVPNDDVALVDRAIESRHDGKEKQIGDSINILEALFDTRGEKLACDHGFCDNGSQ